jgi:rod shape-determining protein MreC
VIARSPTDIDRSVTIDLGSNDGIAVNDPVLSEGVLIGRIESVSSNAARVGLIINGEQAVSAVVSGRNADGVLQTASTESSPVLRLAFVEQGAELNARDIVVTSGWSTGSLRSVYPAGILIGWVSSVGSSPADVYQTVQVTPYADFSSIREVAVLVPSSGERVSYKQPPAVISDGTTRSSDRRADPAATPVRQAQGARATSTNRTARAGQ